MTADARYSYSPERNRLLLLALVQAWSNKCYWCRTPKTFRDLEIDHIVPRNPRGGLEPDFDVDAAENLAPICGPCNKEKSNGEFEDAPRIDAMRNAAVKAAPKVRRNLERFYKDDGVVKALLAVTAADLASPDVAEAISAFGAAIMPVFREIFPEILTETYTWDYTIRKPPLTFQGQEVDLPGERSIAELDAQGQRALVILEDVIGISMADAIDYVRRSVERDIDEQINSKLRDGMGGYYVNSHADERPCSNGIDVFVSELRYEDAGVVLAGELDGTFIVELEEYDPDPERWSTYRKADFDFAADFSVTFCRGEVSDAWVDVTKLAENEWRGRASRMQFYDE
jgi:HNH endonuclease